MSNKNYDNFNFLPRPHCNKAFFNIVYTHIKDMQKNYIKGGYFLSARAILYIVDEVRVYRIFGGCSMAGASH